MMFCTPVALLQRNILLFIVVCLTATLPTIAQSSKTSPVKGNIITTGAAAAVLPDHDSTYYHSFDHYITTRFYFSQKYAGLELERPIGVSKFRYVPNTSLTMGVGVTYQSISLNLGYGFGFLNNDGIKGKTRYLDLQSHIYGRAWTIDMLGQFYSGYYLTPKGLAASSPDAYYIRPDLKIRLFGVSAYHLLNADRFSYRAAHLQNEKQLRSAGSILIGAETYYGIVKADSSLVPSALSENYGQKGVRRLDFIKLGPGIGYAYTLVIQKNFFLTGSLCASATLDYSYQQGAKEKAEKFDVNKDFIYRIVAGYDKNNWNVNLALVGNQLTVTSATTKDKYLLSSGNFRLTLAHRFAPGHKLSNRLRPLDDMIRNVRGR
ncbi:MAG TPA: DUF4421 domain-containing protein [Chitinophagaceae bacterium]|nr:DUF4421 domain-containing protein [Chitinophagaceae bacterium]